MKYHEIELSKKKVMFAVVVLIFCQNLEATIYLPSLLLILKKRKKKKILGTN